MRFLREINAPTVRTIGEHGRIIHRTSRFSFSAISATIQPVSPCLNHVELHGGRISRNTRIDAPVSSPRIASRQISKAADFNKYSEHRYLWKVRAVYGNFDVWIFSRARQSGSSYLRRTEVELNCIEFRASG